MVSPQLYHPSCRNICMNLTLSCIFIWKGIMTIRLREEISIIRSTTTHLLDPQEYASNLHTINIHPRPSRPTGQPSLICFLYYNNHLVDYHQNPVHTKTKMSLLSSCHKIMFQPLTPSLLTLIKNRKYASLTSPQSSRRIHQTTFTNRTSTTPLL